MIPQHAVLVVSQLVLFFFDLAREMLNKYYQAFREYHGILLMD